MTSETHSISKLHQSLPLSSQMVSFNVFISLLTTILALIQPTFSCFTSLVSFGDSYTDNGNFAHWLHVSPQLPNGETFFHRASGRFSDGRLIIDFIADELGLPLIPPFFGNTTSANFSQGVNFAVAGATVLPPPVFVEHGVNYSINNISLTRQLSWLKNDFCLTTNCKKYLQSSLVVMGEIGLNDYNIIIFSKKSKKVVKPFIPLIVDAIASSVQEVIELGASTIIVPGNIPMGCSPNYLTEFSNDSHNPTTGCLNWPNDVTKQHNNLLQKQLANIQQHNPNTTIMYADYYNAAMHFFHTPEKYGFLGGEVLTACCGRGGLYNYNQSIFCGRPGSNNCDDPSSYVSWDGSHMTEAAYKQIAKGVLHGPFMFPPFHSVCAVF